MSEKNTHPEGRMSLDRGEVRQEKRCEGIWVDGGRNSFSEGCGQTLSVTWPWKKEL